MKYLCTKCIFLFLFIHNMYCLHIYSFAFIWFCFKKYVISWKNSLWKIYDYIPLLCEFSSLNTIGKLNNFSFLFFLFFTLLFLLVHISNNLEVYYCCISYKIYNSSGYSYIELVKKEIEKTQQLLFISFTISKRKWA